MADTIQFELVAPENLIFTGDVELVVVPGSEGDFGVLPGHANVISTVRPGVIEIHDNGELKDRYFVSGGYAEVTAKRCTILSIEALPISDVSEKVAKERFDNAETEVNNANTDIERERAENNLNVARAMMEIAKN
ncbi:MAG: ATP synthase F1 subunit epsilon [Alphaproteobacteria bacterium]|nr:ATP synthase F1 subunit epsilon [Alphaproteobacteria bacterium]|tara:strand:+ start:1041 stop:1445 length:405 start_codon:yes stop_codon:yes gene_type:complete